ncbi:hypothetical protein R5H30_16590 [Sulfitobacter sp. D35]|nr:hypothetical protein [Sulfitobacter sp. D35]MDW4499613.1 hypothetical protein [Sulfitobacter sp. D35]
MSNNKILTVSYGTFSCTLEGFDDSFGTMKAIAEYFRDLAADDRYFGAEPPQPDADMLARIAQREISRRVEAREQDGRIMLRAEEAREEAARPGPVREPVSEPVQVTVPETPVRAAPGPSAAALVAAAAPAATEVMPTGPDLETPAPSSEIVAEVMPAAEVEAHRPEPEIEDPAEPEVETYEADEAASEVDVADENDQDDAIVDAISIGVAEDHAVEDLPVTDDVVATEDEGFAAAEGMDVPAYVADEPVEHDFATDEAEAETAANVSTPDGVEETAEPETLADFDGEDAVAVDPAPAAAPQREGIAAKLQRIRDVVMKRHDAVETPASREDDTVQDDLDAAPAGAIADANDTLTAAARDIEDALNADDELDAMLMSGTAEDAEVFRAEDMAEADSSETDVAEISDDTDAPHAAAVSALSLDAEVYEEDYDDGMDLTAIRSQLNDAMGVTPGASDNVFAEPETLEHGSTDHAMGEDSIVADVAEDDWAEPGEAVAIGYDQDDEDSFDDADFEDDFDDEVADEPLILEARIVEPQMDDGADVAETESLEAEASESEIEDVVLDDAEVSGSTLTPEEEEALRRELADVEAEDDMVAEAAPRSRHQRHADDEDVTRLMAEAEEKMGDPETSDRRQAFSHLRAAVAAKKADEALGTEEPETEDQSAYRNDLAEAVKPRRPVRSEERSESRPAPLKLVAEQRIDAEAPRPAGPVQPRRVASLAAEDSADESGEGFAEFAEAKGAVELPEVLEAAAAYLSFVEGRDDFSRQQLMQRLRQVKAGDAFSREDSLRSFGQLIRSGKIEKIRGGRFSASERIGFKPDHRAAG